MFSTDTKSSIDAHVSIEEVSGNVYLLVNTYMNRIIGVYIMTYSFLLLD